MNIDLQIKQHKHIIVCGDNMNSLNILRSLGEKGIIPIVIMEDEGHLPLISYSKYAGEIIHVQGFEETLSILSEYANIEYPPFIYLTDDNNLQLIDDHYDLLASKFYFFNAKREGRITYFLDKEKQCALAKECGLLVPNFEEVERGQLPQNLNYPIITKTSNSYSAGWKRDVTICYSPSELSAAYKQMISKRLLLQEYIEKIGEYSMQGISLNGGEEIYMPFERMYLRYTKTSFGGYMYYQPFNNQELKKKVQRMLREIGFSGCFEIEFLVDKNNQLHFLEINFRFSGSNYGVNTGGVNLPYLWAMSVLLNTIDISNLPIKTERYYVMNEVSDFMSAGKVGIFTWLKQLFSADGYYLYNSKDMKPFYNWWIQKLKRKLSVPRA
ncbi:MAG: ATP-grasp domain-containing protein [Paludibacteraceae bacterium]|nr:ATP-grasp domain-containing protein [Paludibacteraceae bacterium]